MGNYNNRSRPRRKRDYTSEGSPPAGLDDSPVIIDLTTEYPPVPVARPVCERCGLCCTLDYIPVNRSSLTVEGLFLIKSRGGRVVTLNGDPGLYLEYPLRCAYLTPMMTCGLWDTPLRPVPCEQSPCLKGRVREADLSFLGE